MKRPNFFCDIQTANYLINNLSYPKEHPTVNISVDIIEIPYWFLFSADNDNWSLKVIDRGELFSHNEDTGIEAGNLTVNKSSGDGDGRTNSEALQQNMGAFFNAFRNLSYYVSENNLMAEFENLDPEKEGIMLECDGNRLTYQIVSGKDRPDLMCSSIFGGNYMTRPYAEDVMESFARDMMSIDEKIEAADNGDETMMEELALAYLNGDDVRKNSKKSLYWFTKLAELNNSVAQYNLALHYAKGYGTERDFEKAAYWMSKAAENGDEDAPLVAEKYVRAAELTKLADSGDAQAQADLARILTELSGSFDHAGPKEDLKLAFELATKSAEQNNGDGIWTLALCYEHGRGVRKNKTKAIELYSKGAELGHAPSQHSFGCLYINGSEFKKDLKMAFELFEKSAVQGYKLAQMSLAKMYENGEGVEEDLDKAIEWGEKAATDGTAEFQYEVAKLYTYANEDGEMIDAERAKYWYTQAAEKGHRTAQMALNSPMFNPDSDNKEEFEACGEIIKALCEGKMEAEEAFASLAEILGDPYKAMQLLSNYFGIGEDDNDDDDE